MVKERPIVFDCKGESLLGILHSGSAPSPRSAMVLIVGGPQYRAGSHRQFVLLARDVAAAGIPVLRFDYRGMGDSGGSLRDFSEVSADIRQAIDALQAAIPSIRQVTLWGLCDAASAAAFYGWQDDRISSMVLLNPWVRTQAGEARAYLQHYYWQRLLSVDFWKKLLSGRLGVVAAVKDFIHKLRQARGESASVGADVPADLPLPERMYHGLQRFSGQVLVILSGQDLVAKEFEERLQSNRQWLEWLERDDVKTRRLTEADHTFSRREWRNAVSKWTIGWLKSATETAGRG